MSILKESRDNQAQYWEERQTRIIEAGEKSAAELVADLQKTYEATFKKLQKEIEAFYGRYATETGLSIADIQKRLSPAELKSAKEDIARYYAEVKRLGLDPEYKTYLRELSARAYMSRLNELQLNIRHEVEKLHAIQQRGFNEGLKQVYEDSYYQSMFNIQQATGISGSFTALNTRVIEKAVAQKWIGDNYSNRIWANKDRLISNINRIIPQGIAQGQNPRVIARDIRDAMGTSYNNAVRLARTEFNHIANDATYDSYKESEVVEKYKFLATLDNRTSEICSSLDSEVFELREKIEGVNWPPVHPNCVHPDMIIASPDADAITKSYYSGDIFKIGTADGRFLTITPNHIMLTSRGWVRAKNLVKGDKIIYYRGWDKFTSPLAGGNPKNNDSIPTIEQLFASIAKSGLVSAVTMPASSEYFKGDVVEDSEVNIVNINSFLRNKLNSAFSKFVCDAPLIETDKIGETTFSTFGSMALLLMGIGLASDGILSGIDISQLILNGSFAHHELIGLRNASHYNARLIKSANNGAVTDTESFGNVSDAFSVLIKRNDFSSIEDFSGDIGIEVNRSDSNSTLYESSPDNFTIDVDDFCYLIDALATFVEFDSIINIKIDSFIGHVYDVSSLSTLYYCNGFLSSNCRSTTIPYFPPDEIDAMFNDAATRIARDPETGRNYFIPAEMSYREWRESLTESQGQMFLARQKMDKYNQADKDQFASYKDFIRDAKKEHGAELVGKLFPDFPRSISEFQSMKYLGRFERDGKMIMMDWEAVKENRQRLR